MSLWRWFKTLIRLKPHLYIGGMDHPYMKRWYVIPRNPWLNVYLHKFLRDDDDRAVHDHPWWFLSLVLWGRYWEWDHVNAEWPAYTRGFGSIAFRRAEHRHIITLPDGPCWTLVITGPKKRVWGFWCPKGFVPWTEFTKPGNEGEIGKGCGE